MSPDLDTRIRDYGERLDGRAAPLETLVQRSVSDGAATPAARSRWILATGAAAVLLVAIGGVALLTGLVSGGGGAPVATAPDVATLTFEDGTWQRTMLPAELSVGDVAATSFGLVATAGPEGIWISVDGGEWEQVFVGPNEPFSGTTSTLTPPMTAPPPPGNVETYIRHVVEYERALYAVGTNVTGINGPHMTGRMIAYRSEDGQNWEETVIKETGDTLAGIHPIDLVATNSGLIVYEESTIYRSDDGRTWAEVDPSSTGLAAVGLSYGVSPFSGGFIAVGDLPSPSEGESLLGVYRSVDGITWEPIAGATYGRDDYSALHPSSVAEYGGVLFLGGFEMVWETGHQAALWRSSDGTSFERIDLAAEFSLINDLISTPYGLLAIGWSWETETEPARLILLASNDGHTFLPHDDREGILDNVSEPAERAGALFGNTVVLFGLGVGQDGEPVNLQWTWTPDG